MGVVLAGRHGALTPPRRPLGKAERRAAVAVAWYSCPRCHAPPGEDCWADEYHPVLTRRMVLDLHRERQPYPHRSRYRLPAADEVSRIILGDKPDPP